MLKPDDLRAMTPDQAMIAVPTRSAAPLQGRTARCRSTAATLDTAGRSVAVAGTTGGYQGAGSFLDFIHDAERGVKPRGTLEGRGPLAILLIVLVGGLALNLTPCVLPMIPINLAIIDGGVKRFGSGWSWLVWDGTGLAVYATANQDSPIMQSDVPLLGIDVWEHAYYLKYQNKRPAYLEAWWNVVNWPEVERRFAEAQTS